MPEQPIQPAALWWSLCWLPLALLVVALDQLSKQWIVANFVLYQPRPILPFFSLMHARNEGAAFSFLHDAGGWQQWFFIAVAGLVSGAILLWLLRLPRSAHWQRVALLLILGGALGNLWDRLTLGYVIDFLLFHYEAHAFPVFNVADSAITAGATMLILDTLFLSTAASRRGSHGE